MAKDITEAGVRRAIGTIEKYLGQKAAKVDGQVKPRIIRQAGNNVTLLKQHVDTLEEKHP